MAFTWTANGRCRCSVRWRRCDQRDRQVWSGADGTQFGGPYQTAPLPYGAEGVPPKAPVQLEGKGEFVLGLFGKDSQPTAFIIRQSKLQTTHQSHGGCFDPGPDAARYGPEGRAYRVRRQNLHGRRILKPSSHQVMDVCSASVSKPSSLKTLNSRMQSPIRWQAGFGKRKHDAPQSG